MIQLPKDIKLSIIVSKKGNFVVQFEKDELCPVKKFEAKMIIPYLTEKAEHHQKKADLYNQLIPLVNKMQSMCDEHYKQEENNA